MTLDDAECCSAECHGISPKASKTKGLSMEIHTLHSASTFITLGHLHPSQIFVNKDVHPCGATIYLRLFARPANILL